MDLSLLRENWLDCESFTIFILEFVIELAFSNSELLFPVDICNSYFPCSNLLTNKLSFICSFFG